MRGAFDLFARCTRPRANGAVEAYSKVPLEFLL